MISLLLVLKNISCVSAVKTQEENILGIDPDGRAPSSESSINLILMGHSMGAKICTGVIIEVK